MKSIEVEILGKKYYFKTDNPVKLREHAEYLDSQLEELYEKFNTIDQNKLYVLYSLILTEKYLAEVEKNKILSQSSKKIDNLLDELTIESEIWYLRYLWYYLCLRTNYSEGIKPFVAYKPDTIRIYKANKVDAHFYVGSWKL